MKRSFLTILKVIGLCCFLSSQTNSISIDFGGNSSLSPWNNLNNPHIGQLANLTDRYGFRSDISVMIIDSFNGVNQTGTLDPLSDLNIPPTASGDSFFGNTAPFSGMTQPTGELLLTGLDSSKTYTLELFASRIADNNRETQYIIKGKTSDTLLLQVADNTSKMAMWQGKATEDREIAIEVGIGPDNNSVFGFFYLGALRLSFEDEIPDITYQLLSPRGGELWEIGREVDINWAPIMNAPIYLEYDTGDGILEPIDTLLQASQNYRWIVSGPETNEAQVRISNLDTVLVNTSPFKVVAPRDTCRIVVIGSSTAAGTGASPRDSAWVFRYQDYLYQRATYLEVVNLAKGGYTTYHLLPDQDTSGALVDITVDSSRNITEAVSRDPSVIIVNLPSNDTGRGFTTETQLLNFRKIASAATQSDIPIYICTTQPRNYQNAALVETQMEVRDGILEFFGDFAIDFWTDIASPEGRIIAGLDSGDGVHLNNRGHKLLFEKVKAKLNPSNLCSVDTTATFDTLNLRDEFFSIYPNPSRGDFTLSWSEDILVNSVELLSIDGRQLASIGSVARQSNSIEINDLPGGSYVAFAVIQGYLDGELRTWVKKLVVGL